MEEGGEGVTLINSLRSQLKSLQLRVKDLELENAVLYSRISNCRCQKSIGNCDHSIVSGDCSVENNKKFSSCSIDTGSLGESCNNTNQHEGSRCFGEANKKKSSGDASTGCETEILKHYTKRYVALKIMYFGKRFYGFASESQMDPTVESEIFKALRKTMLMVGDKKESMYSRCGRTDKGVSSVGQVISLFLRSKFKDHEVHADCEKISPKDISEEIDYVRVLNRVLPNDIRVISWCPAPVDFHARFSCLSREYKYLFWKGNLNISAMETAGEKFIGEHDFRNFCKMDAANVHNYRRHITLFGITPCKERSKDDQLWALTIKGSAFLWHQVRCMVAVLFMIGQGLESPSVIDELLDTKRTPRKPQYKMAPELPLILRSCDFEGLNFDCSPETGEVLLEHLKNEMKSHKLQAAIFEEAMLSCSTTINGESPLISGTKKIAHVPLMLRPTEPSYEERQSKLKARTTSE